MNKKGIEYVEVVLLILVGVAILALLSGFLIQNIFKINFSNICNEFDYLVIEDSCINNSKPYLLYLFLSRPIQARGDISFSLKITNGYSKVIEFNNETFFEYYDGNLSLGDPNIKPGEGKSFVVFLDFYNISNFEEISVNVIKINKNKKENCESGKSFKIKNCSNFNIKNLPNINISFTQPEENKVLFLPI